MIKAIDLFFILLAIGIFSWGLRRRFRLWQIGREENRSNKKSSRLKSFFFEGIIHARILEDLYPGLIHLFLFLGFLAPFTVMVITQFIFTLPSVPARLLSLALDLIGLAAILSLFLAMYRRYVTRPSRLDNKREDFLTLILLLFIIMTGFILEGLRLSVIGSDTQAWAPLGKVVASLFDITGMSIHAKSLMAAILFRIHFFLVMGTIAYIPYSKLFHLISSPMNMIFRSLEPKGALTPLDLEDEKTESFGVAKIEEFTWKQLLDLDACTRCGRCQDRCPAHLTEKPLSPKKLITDLKDHLHARAPQILEAGAKGIEPEDIPPLVGKTIDENVIWTCTTCRSCMEHCPVYIEQVDKIVDLRRYQVLMESRFPAELNSFFRNMETNSNPWGIGFASRADWAQGLDVKLINEHPQAEFLFWVGCAGSFDEEGKKVAKAMVSIMNKAGLNYAILGTEEKCCGDSARRLGNEYLFQMQASENINLFRKYNIRKIITICPHGYNTFKNEYPKLFELLSSVPPESKEKLKEIEVIHHVQLLHKLLREEKLPLKSKLESRLAYHDSCYLARYNDIISEPREVLQSLTSESLVEPKNNKQHSLCCGGGGGLMWTEETLGTRINQLRTAELLEAQAEMTATSCPFCLTMIQDGFKDKGENERKVKDIAQLVAELLEE
ncbi:MAG: 4Fe-4S dicluster domain-containing protein [Candidatus Aminicenantes bacterium]|nr:4Fe-4S dicluster domain-containing protein [Candidatus Aminicenantes bacterium]